MGDIIHTALGRKNFLMPSSKFDDQKYEFIFVLDRSGSMSWGNRIELAKRALELFLRSLPVTCYFNIIGYGTGFKRLFPKSVAYTEDNVATAVAHAKNVQANMLENNLLSVFQNIYSTPQFNEYLQQVFVLTDGGEPDSDKANIIDLVTNNKTWGRIFALGVGEPQCRSLVEQIALAGGGTSEFTPSSDNIESKIIKQLKFALTPSLLKAVRSG